MPAPKCLCMEEKAASKSCMVGDSGNPRCLDAEDLQNPMRWARGRGSKGKPELARFGVVVKAVPDGRAKRQQRIWTRFGVKGKRKRREATTWSCPLKTPDSLRFGAGQEADSKGVYAGHARPGLLPGPGNLQGSYCQPGNS